MLRPIPEDESDHGAVVQDDMDSLSAAADADSLDGNGASRSVISAASAVLADGRDDPEAKDGLIKPKRKRHRRRRRWAYWRSLTVMGVVVVAAVVIVVVILVTTDGTTVEEAAATGATNTPAPTEAPTVAAPTVAPTIDPGTLATLDSLVNAILVPTNDLDTSLPAQVEAILASARTKAKEWMLTKDLLRDEILADPTSIRFTQRYVLVLLMYSMELNGGDVEAIEEQILAAEQSECAWFGVFCDDAIVEQTETTTIQLPVIRRINWGEQSAIGAMPPEIRSLVYLQELNVSFNALQGGIPTEWFETPPERNVSNTVPEVEQNNYLPYLYLLDFGHNNIGGSIPFGLWSRPSLRFVYMSNNSFTGQAFPSEDYFRDTESIPSPFLEDIWIDSNTLSGAIYRWIFTLPNLQSFIAERNVLGGTLPDLDSKVLGPIPLPATLQVLDLSFNNITGSLPAALFQGDALEFLYLDNNEFKGQLPSYGVPEFSALIDVWLHFNELTGRIPDSFGADWDNLSELRLQSNQLTGTVVAGCQEPLLWPENARVEADCLNNSPVECVCCGTCS